MEHIWHILLWSLCVWGCVSVCQVMTQGWQQHLRIGLHELSVSAHKMSPLRTEETKCCSHHIHVKYYLRVILHFCFREHGVPNGWFLTPDTFWKSQECFAKSACLACYWQLSWHHMNPSIFCSHLSCSGLHEAHLGESCTQESLSGFWHTQTKTIQTEIHSYRQLAVQLIYPSIIFSLYFFVELTGFALHSSCFLV